MGWIAIYVAIAAIVALVSFMIADSATPQRSAAAAGATAIAVGLVWPVLLAGLVQVLVVAGVVETARQASSRRRRREPTRN